MIAVDYGAVARTFRATTAESRLDTSETQSTPWMEAMDDSMESFLKNE